MQIEMDVQNTEIPMTWSALENSAWCARIFKKKKYRKE